MCMNFKDVNLYYHYYIITYYFKGKKVKAHYHRLDTQYWILSVYSKEIPLKS